MISFSLTEKQQARYENWQKHIKNIHGRYGEYIFSFQPTGIGDIVSVYSSLERESLDLTEEETW
jgi:hypothetical protein